MTEYNRLNITEISEKLRAGEISARELTRLCLDNIGKSDLNALNTLCAERAMRAAELADGRLSRGESGALLGVPVIVKDNICMDGVRTTCSSKILENYIPPYDATVVKRLDAAGAVILGKSNMDEFAMGSSNETSYFGKVKNPVNPEYVPGGSSGGSAAAVGASLAFASLGSDTGGSIRQPASVCGIVGLKPTYGTVSRYGLIAFGSSLDQIGPFTRSVRDSALMMNVLAGHDPLESTSFVREYPDFTKRIRGSVKGLKLGVPKEYFIDGTDPEVRAAVEKTIAFYEAEGAELVEVSLPLTDVGLAVYYIIACAEAASNLSRFDGVKYGYRAKDFDNLVDLYVRSRTEGFGAEVKRRIMLGNYVLSSGYYDAYYLKALKVRTLVKEDCAKAFEKCDLLISPTSPTTAFKFGEKSKDPLTMYMSDVFTVAANIAGLPAISIPCGKSAKGLPIGVQLMGPAFSEGEIFNAAEYYESREGSKWITR